MRKEGLWVRPACWQKKPQTHEPIPVNVKLKKICTDIRFQLKFICFPFFLPPCSAFFNTQGWEKLQSHGFLGEITFSDISYHFVFSFFVQFWGKKNQETAILEYRFNHDLQEN